MARQQIAQDWKIKEILFDQMAQKFTESEKPFGRFTQATVTEKIHAIAAKRGYRWKDKQSHGFGGYWVDGDGNTLEVLPGIPSKSVHQI